MNIPFYHTLHIISLLVLAAYTFFAFAGPAPETKKRVMMITGIAALLMIISGVGLMHKFHYKWEAWVFIKIACWLGVSALAGIAYRRPGARGVLSSIAIVLLSIAVYTVYHASKTVALVTP